MSIKFANSAFATLAAGINSSATSITLTTGQGARFPSLGAGDYFYATLIDASNNLEIVKCTARSTDVLTVTRAQESTTARSFSTGDRIELRITAAGLNEAVGILDGDRGDITVSGDGLVWTIDNGVVTDAKITAMAATKLTGTIDRARLPAGAILQVNQFMKTDSWSSSGGWNDPGLDVSITPFYSTSKILVMVGLAMGTAATTVGMRVRRNGTNIALSNSESGCVQTSTVSQVANIAWQGQFSFIYLDSPATTSALTYDVVLNSHDARTYYLNRSQSGPANNGTLDNATSCSTITVMEVAA